MVKNQLHHYLHQQYPGYGDFFSDPFGVAARAFFSRFPSPGHLRGYGVNRLGAFLKRQAANLGEKKARQILKQVDKLSPKDEASGALDGVIPTLIDLLGQLDGHVEGIEHSMERHLRKSPYQLRTMPGLGDILAATLEAEIGDIERFRCADQLARYAGIAPVEHSSGSRSRRRHRPYGRRRLNKAFYLLALGQIKRCNNGYFSNPEARRYYERKLAEGKTPKHALRCLMRRLVDIIYAMMRDRSVYRMSMDLLSPADEEVVAGRNENPHAAQLQMLAAADTAMSLAEP